MEYPNEWARALLATLPGYPWVETLLGLLLLGLVALVMQWGVARLVLYAMRRLLKVSGKAQWDVALRRNRAYHRVWHMVPFMVLYAGFSLVPHVEPAVPLVSRLALAACWLMFFRAVGAVLHAWQDVYSASTRAQTRSIKGYIQLGRIAVGVVGTVVIVALLVGRSPLLLISGLGAMSAVLLLVFKDTLLSVVASTQLTSNDMLRIGDWIEMPQAGADGFVIDIALHTVKVENWDKTVTTIPTYKLFSESYRNWRHMFQSGGRRIKRTIRLDAGSVRFLSDEDCERLKRFRLLHDYLEGKQDEIGRTNSELAQAGLDPINHRRLTNIGTFRAYAMAYVRAHAEINHDMIMMVRMLEPQANGIPVEVYCFTASTAWVEYERIQGDIFDHLLAVLPELGLRTYQAPSGADFSQALSPRENAMRLGADV
jgi:miniconductance mechanosensitive channel